MRYTAGTGVSDDPNIVLIHIMSKSVLADRLQGELSQTNTVKTNGTEVNG